MKQLYKPIGFSILVFFIMFFSNTMIMKYNEKDPLMLEIKENSMKYSIEPVNAIIEDNTISSGTYGKKVNILKTFHEMKKYGAYNELLMVFQDVKPAVSIDDYYDHYLVRGNGLKREVAFLFIIRDEKEFYNITSYLKNKRIPATLFLDGTLLEKQSSSISRMNSFEIELLNYNQSFEEVFFKTSLSYLEVLTKNKPLFCFTENENFTLLEMCRKEKMHTIKGTIIHKDLYLTIKKSLKNSMIIPVEGVSSRDLLTTIQYLEKKGYSFVSAKELFLEQNQ